MDDDYALEWLDLMVSEKLDVDRVQVEQIDKHQSELIICKVTVERHRQFIYIKKLVFNQSRKRRIQLGMDCYYFSLTKLIEAAETNINKISAGFSGCHKALEGILSCLREIRSFIIERYSAYLDPDVPLPASNQVSLINKFTSLKESHFVAHEPVLACLLFQQFERAFECENKDVVTLRKVNYWQNLYELLVSAGGHHPNSDPFTGLETLLIRSNFNSPDFVKYLTDKVSAVVSAQRSSKDGVFNLNYFQKSFNQISIMQVMICDTRYGDLGTIMNIWFSHEIRFYSEFNDISPKINSTPHNKSNTYIKKNPEKIMCTLTVDQIALFFKAADQLNVITARSLSAIFQAVAPHLSTPNTTDISHGSLRAKTYAVEDRDKVIVLEILNKLSRQIEDL